MFYHRILFLIFVLPLTLLEASHKSLASSIHCLSALRCFDESMTASLRFVHIIIVNRLIPPSPLLAVSGLQAARRRPKIEDFG